MVRTLHEEGIEVILDVVYNHTAEGNHLAHAVPESIDNAAYYRLVAGRPPLLLRHHRDGNSLTSDPHTLQLIMDSLRYWVPRCTSTVPLRPGRQPGPAVPRGRPAVRVLA